MTLADPTPSPPSMEFSKIDFFNPSLNNSYQGTGIMFLESSGRDEYFFSYFELFYKPI